MEVKPVDPIYIPVVERSFEDLDQSTVSNDRTSARKSLMNSSMKNGSADMDDLQKATKQAQSRHQSMMDAYDAYQIVKQEKKIQKTWWGFKSIFTPKVDTKPSLINWSVAVRKARHSEIKLKDSILNFSGRGNQEAKDLESTMGQEIKDQIKQTAFAVNKTLGCLNAKHKDGKPETLLWNVLFNPTKVSSHASLNKEHKRWEKLGCYKSATPTNCVLKSASIDGVANYSPPEFRSEAESPPSSSDEGSEDFEKRGGVVFVDQEKIYRDLAVQNLFYKSLDRVAKVTGALAVLGAGTYFISKALSTPSRR